MTDQNNPKPLIHRTTAITEAFMAAAIKAGLDVNGARLPMKHEPAWTVTRRDPAGKRRGRK